MRLKAKTYNRSQASVDMWVRMLRLKEERSKKNTNNRDEHATKDVGSDTALQAKKRGSEKKNNSHDKCSDSSGTK